MTKTATILQTASITTIAVNTSYGPKLSNAHLNIMQDSYADENCYYPQQTICLNGQGIKELRDYLNTLPLE